MIGDLALLHDLNSLALFKDCKTPVVITVMNNNGGGIFHYLPVSQTAINFETYFGTPHHMGFESAASLFNLDYAHPKSSSSYVDVYKNALLSKRLHTY